MMLMLAVMFILVVIWMRLEARYLFNSIGPSSKELLENQYDIHKESSIVINVDLLNCVHVGTFFEICPWKDTLFPDIRKGFPKRSISKSVINKDLKGSKGFQWFGQSKYVQYYTLQLDSKTDLEWLDNEYGIIDIWGIKDITGYKEGCELSLGGMCFKVEMLNQKNFEISISEFLSEFTFLFGEDAKDPRPNWLLDKDSFVSMHRYPAYLSKRNWIDSNDLGLIYRKPTLSLNENGKFKIVQLADLHFSVGEGICRDEFPKHESCKADPKSGKFVEEVLDIEQPDLVVFTGDQIMGDLCKQDSETALLKALAPVISRRIPWAMIWGNHDDEGSLTRWEISLFVKDLPYSLFQIGPLDTSDNTFGVGNYVHEVVGQDDISRIALYFFDSHKYSPNPKVFSGYDWIKEAQWKHMEDHAREHVSLEKGIQNGHLLSMAFFHIPIPEYNNFGSEEQRNRMVGSLKEGVTAPKYNSGGIETLHKLGVSVTSAGHDHCNDYCLLDGFENGKTWLCYGGAGGEGGYGGYGGTERRIRIYEINALKKDIFTWKRLNGSPEKTFDEQKLVSDGVPYTV